MKKIKYQRNTVLILALAFMINASGQQYKTHDTIQLKEITIPSGFAIDTTVQKILFVLEKQPIKDEPCEYLDFIVLYDNCSGIRFEMGPIINIHPIYWVSHGDSIIFFSTSIYNKLKPIKKPDQIEKYLLVHGQRENYYLVQTTPGYFWSYDKSSVRISNLFKKEDMIDDCKLEYYNRAIGKK